MSEETSSKKEFKPLDADLTDTIHVSPIVDYEFVNSPHSDVEIEDNESVKSEKVDEDKEEDHIQYSNIDVSSELKKKVSTQLEYYMGDENLSKDKYLRSKMNNGEIPITIFLTFPKLQDILAESNLSNDKFGDIIFTSIKSSQLLLVSSNGRCIKRIKPFSDRSQIPRDPLTTIIVENLDEKVTQELLFELISQGGPIKNVFLPVDNNGLCKGNAQIQFTGPESVEYCIQLFHGIRLYNKRMILHHYYDQINSEKGADVYIGNLNYPTDLFELYTLFSQYGDIASCSLSSFLSKDKHTGAFFNFTKREMTDEAVKNLNEYKFDGSIMSVDYSKKCKDFRIKNDVRMIFVRSLYDIIDKGDRTIADQVPQDRDIHSRGSKDYGSKRYDEPRRYDNTRRYNNNNNTRRYDEPRRYDDNNKRFDEPRRYDEPRRFDNTRRYDEPKRFDEPRKYEDTRRLNNQRYDEPRRYEDTRRDNYTESKFNYDVSKTFSPNHDRQPMNTSNRKYDTTKNQIPYYNNRKDIHDTSSSYTYTHDNESPYEQNEDIRNSSTKYNPKYTNTNTNTNSRYNDKYTPKYDSKIDNSSYNPYNASSTYSQLNSQRSYKAERSYPTNTYSSSYNDNKNTNTNDSHMMTNDDKTRPSYKPYTQSSYSSFPPPYSSKTESNYMNTYPSQRYPPRTDMMRNNDYKRPYNDKNYNGKVSKH